MATTLLTRVIDGPEDVASITVSAANAGKLHRVAVSVGYGMLHIRYNGHAEYELVARLYGGRPGKQEYVSELNEDDVLRFTPLHPYQGRVTFEALLHGHTGGA